MEDCPIFGVPLEVAVERNRCHDGIPLPMVVRQCIDYIEEHGLMMEGVYRYFTRGIAGDAVHVMAVQTITPYFYLKDFIVNFFIAISFVDPKS